jgi:dipeptidyl-peptidase-4
VDAANGRTSLLVDSSSLVLPGESRKPVSLSSAVWLPDGRSLLVPSGGGLFVLDVSTGSFRVLTETPQDEEFPEVSPDGRRVAFVRDNDLYVVEVATGHETRLTKTGSDTLLNGRLDWVYEEELAPRSGEAFSWSPDSRSVAYLQLDQTRVPTFPIVDFLPVRNEVAWQRYPKAGSPNSVVRVGVVSLLSDGSAGPERTVSFDPDDCYVAPQLAWTADSRSVAFQHIDRAQSTLDLRLLPVPRSPAQPLGPPTTVLTERSRTWVNLLGPPRFLKDGRRFLWLSERDGFAHVYVCDLAGDCRAVTRGPWVVDARVSFTGPPEPIVLDERSGFVYFSANEKDPRETHLYRVRLDGTGFARLTREDGTHRVTLSPGGRYYVDTWSNLATPPRVWVTSQDGTKRFVVDENAHPPILDYERGVIEPVEVKARDGTTLFASLLKPADFDPERRYPVVVSVYGGPHAQTVTDAWSHVSPRDHLLASRGFLVWKLDNRGTANRGTAFEAPIYHRLGTVELEDQLAGVAYLTSLAFVDPGRIGITGWSYGGYMTLFALTHAPDVFRCGVAGAPVTEWKYYDTIYTERYMGTPDANPTGYQSSSPLARAEALRAPLLLIHGTADDNVHLANTVSFVNALVQAGRAYSLRLGPGQRHGFRTRADKIARDEATVSFFEETLRPPAPGDQTGRGGPAPRR